MNITIYRKLALLTDSEAELCLNGLLKGLTIRKPEYSELLSSPAGMTEIIRVAATDIGSPKGQLGEVTPQERPRAIRLILAEIAENEEFSPKLEAWIDGARPTLLEPVTTALVLAGIVFVLSIDVDIEYENEGGQRKLKIKLKKKPTSEKLLKKFFGFFK